MKNLYVQYGCGLTAPEKWLNFDASPTLRLQKNPILGKILRGQLNVEFPRNVLYGDIIKGLPIPKKSCKAIFCSHVLEHLSLEDFRIALKNTYNLLETGGCFRFIVPDLEFYVKAYIEDLKNNNSNASIDFMSNTLLGQRYRNKNIIRYILDYWSNSKHLWMWDKISLEQELLKVGFKNIRQCKFNDNNDSMFTLVESEGRYNASIGIECYK